MSEKKSLEEKMSNLGQKQTVWIEPMREWIKEAKELPKIAKEDNRLSKKVIAKNIFGSNLYLTQKQIIFKSQKNSLNKLEKHWAAIQATREKINKISKSCVLVPPRGIEPL